MDKKRTESTCACNTCRQMCKTSPCFPTPAEALALMDKGYTHRLRLTIYVDQSSGEMYPASPSQ